EIAIKGYAFVSADKEVSELSDKSQTVTLTYSIDVNPYNNKITTKNVNSNLNTNSYKETKKVLPLTGDSDSSMIMFSGFLSVFISVVGIFYKRKY
ncbi:LPXTG cell wall anchor domain-containing protein, partial [Enterococcus faecalis]